jgi:hypothetical protein
MIDTFYAKIINIYQTNVNLHVKICSFKKEQRKIGFNGRTDGADGADWNGFFILG